MALTSVTFLRSLALAVWEVNSEVPVDREALLKLSFFKAADLGERAVPFALPRSSPRGEVI